MAIGNGALAQLGEHLLCKQGVVGSIPTSSTIPSEWFGTGISRKKVHALRPHPSGFGSPVLTHCEEKTGPEGSTGRKADRPCPGRIARGFIARWNNVPRHTRRLGLRAVASPINVPDRRCRVPSLEAGLSSVLVLQGTRADRAPSQDADTRCTRAGVEGAQKNEAVLFVSLTLALGQRFDEHGR